MSGVTAPRSDLVHVLQTRGFLHQCTDLGRLDELAGTRLLTAYSGFDATADSLHVGHLLPIMMLRWLQKTGHRPIALVGGGTTKVGDPSGKDETRQLLTEAAIDINIASIQKTFNTYLDFSDSETGAVLVNNAEWLDALEYIPFLRDVGKHFTINRMLGMDSVKNRLEREQPLTFLEFNYMILQSYDFVELFKRYGCTLQTGGSDQWGNIVNGVDLGRRLVDAELFGVTCPLLTTSSGAKMGKTAAGAVWLNADRLAPYDYYQYWRNTEDPDVGRFLRLFTELPLDEIARLESLEGAEVNEAKKVLAFQTTQLLHGTAAATEAEKTALQTFEQGETADGLPKISISKSDIDSGYSIIDGLVATQLCQTRGEARRLIAGGGARLNGDKVVDDTQILEQHLFSCGTIKLSAGKKKHAIIELA